MNEDEAIKRLQEILDFKKNTIDKIEDPIEREIEENCYIEEMPFEAIETILDLYKQEKEKNKFLKQRNEAISNNMLSLASNSISKDKIKAKIKELEEKSDYWNCDEIEVLKELLEEE